MHSAWGPTSGSQSLTHTHTNQPGILAELGSGSVSLGQGLRVCISNKLA